MANEQSILEVERRKTWSDFEVVVLRFLFERGETNVRIVARAWGVSANTAYAMLSKMNYAGSRKAFLESNVEQAALQGEWVRIQEKLDRMEKEIYHG